MFKAGVLNFAFEKKREKWKKSFSKYLICWSCKKDAPISNTAIRGQIFRKFIAHKLHWLWWLDFLKHWASSRSSDYFGISFRSWIGSWQQLLTARLFEKPGLEILSILISFYSKSHIIYSISCLCLAIAFKESWPLDFSFYRWRNKDKSTCSNSKSRAKAITNPDFLSLLCFLKS